MNHAPGFLKLVDEARSRVNEVTVDELRQHLEVNPSAILVDVREDHEWNKGHAQQARHIGKGILERDLESEIPDANAEIIMYCGGGFRSILTCDAAQKMGYTNVHSLIGGYKGLVSAKWPMTEV